MKVKSFSIAVLIIYIIVQIVYVLFFQLPLISDSAYSVASAQTALAENTFYPSPSSLFTVGIIAPVYVNCLVLLLKISNGPTIVLLFNILLNVLQLILLYKVTEKLFNARAALIAGLIYILYLNNVGLVLQSLTELPFGVLVLASLYFYVAAPTLRNNLLCGLSIGLAVGVRPTAWALVIAILIIYVITIIQHKAQHRKMICMVVGIVLYVVPMGLLSKQNIGRFEFSSTSGPANLIMSANPRAKGVFDSYIFTHDSIFLAKKTYVEKNEYLLNRSKEFIRENPGFWVSLIPRKIYSIFISDVWAIHPLLHSMRWDFNVWLKGDKKVREEFNNKPLSFRLAFWVLNLWQQMLYGIIFIFFIYQLAVFHKRKYFSLEVLMINLFILGCIAMTILGSVGAPRYKYNFLILGVMLISPFVSEFIDKFVYRGKRKEEVKY